jgi:hypothetical protein
VQLFIEAKRHVPSIIYIPSLTALCASLPETCRALVADSLAALEPHEPILLLAIMTGSLKSLPRDVRAWFGKNNGAKIAFSAPSEAQRRAFFQELLDYVNKPPSQFPDAVKRRRRILEKLPVAPPLPPRELSAAEIAAQEKHDNTLFYKLKAHLSSIFAQCRKADNKFCKATIAETVGSVKTEDGIWWGKPRMIRRPDPASNIANVEGAVVNSETNGEVATPVAPVVPKHSRQRLHDIDMARIHDGIWEGYYYSSSEFLEAVRLVRENAEMEKNDDDPQTKEMFRRADKVFGVAQEEVGRTEPMFNLETERMAERFREKERKARAAKEKRKAEEAAKAIANEQNAVVEATAVATGDGDIAMTLSSPKVETGSEERSALKRSREDEALESDGSHPPSKRMRMSPFTSPPPGEKSVRFVDEAEMPALPSIALNGDALRDGDMNLDPPSPSPNGVASSQSKAIGEDASTVVAPLGLTQHVIDTPSRSPSPAPGTPPEFIASPVLLSTLEEALATKTANLDVEQLEALRALCLNLVWSHKGDWNRDSLMNDMLAQINKYLVEIGEMSDEDE